MQLKRLARVARLNRAAAAASCASAEAEDGNPCPTTRARIWVDGGGVGGLWFVRVSEDVRFQVRNQVRVVSILSAQLHPSFPLPASFSSLSLSLTLCPAALGLRDALAFS